MIQSFNYSKILRENFQDELSWYEEEFDIIFKRKSNEYTEKELELGNQILSNLTQLMSLYPDETFLHAITSLIYNVEKKYPYLFR